MLENSDEHPSIFFPTEPNDLYYGSPFLMFLWRTCLNRGDETSTNPDGLRTIRQRSSETPSVVDRTRGDYVHRLAGERGNLALALVNAGGPEECSRHISRVTTTLTSLCADQVYTLCERFGDVLRVTDHLRGELSEQKSGDMERVLYVHHGDTSSVKLLNDMLGWYTDSTNEQPGLLLDNHVDELAQLAFSVVIL